MAFRGASNHELSMTCPSLVRVKQRPGFSLSRRDLSDATHMPPSSSGSKGLKAVFQRFQLLLASHSQIRLLYAHGADCFARFCHRSASISVHICEHCLLLAQVDLDYYWLHFAWLVPQRFSACWHFLLRITWEEDSRDCHILHFPVDPRAELICECHKWQTSTVLVIVTFIKEHSDIITLKVSWVHLW